MKTLLIILAAMLLQGCVRATYTAQGINSETFKLTSVFKSVDGLTVTRIGNDFTLGIDKTHTQDPMGNMLEIMKMLQAMQYGLPPKPEDDENE